MALLAVAAAALAGGCGDDANDARRTNSDQPGGAGTTGTTGTTGSTTGGATRKTSTHASTTPGGIAKSSGGPGQVVEEYWTAARNRQAERFCAVLVIETGGEPTELPQEACVEAFGKGSAVKVADAGRFERVLGTEVKGSRATVRFRIRTKKGAKTETLSARRTANGWKVLLKTK